MAVGDKGGAAESFTPAILGRIAQAMLDAFDARHGGFGTGQKFPHPEALDFALLWAEKSGNPAFRELVQKSLLEMAQGALLDPVEGGFFRYCATRDWRQPCTEKLLETQAGLLRNYLEAWQRFGRDEFRKVAQKTLSYVDHVLRDPVGGGWFAGQEGDDGYYALAERLRADRKPPRVEATVEARPLSAAISAFLKAGAVLADEKATRRALDAAAFLRGTLWSRGKGVYHSATAAGERQILGRVGDQVFALRALLHVVQYTGDEQALAAVEDLVGTLLQKVSPLWGGFFDVRDDAVHFETARRRHEVLLENGLAAEALLRASWLLARPDWRKVAERALRLFAADYPLYGYHAAEYGRAVELFFFPPQCLYVVGASDDPRAAALLDVARRTWTPSKVVLALDPARDAALLERHRLAAAPEPVAWLRVGDAAHGEIRDPAALAAAMAEVERKRVAT